LLNLDAMLIGTGQKENVMTTELMIASQRIRRDGGIRMPDVGHIIYIVYRGGYKEALSRQISPHNFLYQL